MKKIAGAMISIGIILSLIGCAWQMPEQISVKSKADYNFALGTFEQDLNSDMDLSTFLGDAGNSSNTNLLAYDYYPDKSDKYIQHYLLEVKLADQELMSLTTAQNYPSTTIDCSTLTIANAHDQISLDFNPATILSAMKDALGPEMTGKISFESIPMYLYCTIPQGVSATATFEMYYGAASNPATKRSDTIIQVLNNDPLTNCPKPTYRKEGNIVITNLAGTRCIGGNPIDIKDLVNNDDSSIQSTDKLCIDYTVSALSGAISTESVVEQGGLRFALYAVIDIPLGFKAEDQLLLNINDITGSGGGGNAGQSGDNEFSKIIDIIDQISIKYIAYKLPFYANSGMKLGVDMLGTGNSSDYEYANLNVADGSDDANIVTLKFLTVEQLKRNPNFNPNVQIKVEQGTQFTIPRDKAVAVNLELNIKTDGSIKVK